MPAARVAGTTFLELPPPMRRPAPVLVLFAAGGLAACADPPPAGNTAELANPALGAPDPLAAPQAVSLLGEDLWAQEDTTGAIADADAALALAPGDVDLLIEAGRVRRHAWQYRQEMEFYTRAAELAPDDWRPYRYRGHRHISLRDFSRAAEDLERARELAPLNWDVAYHLGLAYFLDGRFGDAADEYQRCLALAEDPAALAADEDDFRSCAANGTDPESRVAMTEWAVRALLRAGRGDEAEALVRALPADLPVETNVAYHHNLLFYGGELTADDLLRGADQGTYRLETVGFGVANRRLARGDTAAALELLERLAADPWWPGFGRIAAEAELARLR